MEVRERQGGRSGGGGSMSRQFEVIGAADELEAQNGALNLAPNSIGFGLLPADVAHQEVGTDGDYLVTVTYNKDGGLGGSGDPNEEPGSAEYRFNFQARGAHIFQGLEAPTVYVKAGDSTDNYKFGGAINVVWDSGTNRCEGYRIDPPAETYSIRYNAPPDAISASYRSTLETVCGTVNNAAYGGAQAGELMLTRVNGGINTRTGRWDIEYGFARVANRTTPLVIGDTPDTISITSKDGMDLLWVYYGPADGNIGLRPVPLAAFVHKVWERTDYSQLGLPGVS